MKAYRIDECARMQEDSEPDEDSWTPYLNALSKLAAETLRADTAEAALRTERLRADAAVGDANDAERELTAAEQRVSELTSNDSLESVAKTLAACMDYPWQHMPENGRVLMRKHAKDIIDAALNPKPEAGSHE